MSLLYRMDLMSLLRRGFNVDGITFVPVAASLYTNRLELTISTVIGGASGDPKTADYPLVLPFTEGQRLIPIEICDHQLYWDAPDACLRFRPAGAPREAISPIQAIRLYDNGPVRIDKNYAEEHLTPEALAYAYETDDEYYYWNWLDGSAYPVVFELAALFCTFTFLPDQHPLRACGEPTALALGFHAPNYCDKRGLRADQLEDALVENMKKEIHE
ncbi:MAG: hypothetical protein E7223_01930 [Clostridiales bacterium]|nr:hypothetical protein [Clostridiales bacterium]